MLHSYTTKNLKGLDILECASVAPCFRWLCFWGLSFPKNKLYTFSNEVEFLFVWALSNAVYPRVSQVRLGRQRTVSPLGQKVGLVLATLPCNMRHFITLPKPSTRQIRYSKYLFNWFDFFTIFLVEIKQIIWRKEYIKAVGTLVPKL